MNPSIKEMVDAAVAEFSDEFFHLKVPCHCPKGGLYEDGRTCSNCFGTEYQLDPPIMKWLRTTLADITENAVASERARVREWAKINGNFYVGVGNVVKVDAVVRLLTNPNNQ